MTIKSFRTALHDQVRFLLEDLEQEIGFGFPARRVLDVGEAEIAFKSLYLYLLGRDALWANHHARINAIKARLSPKIDFDRLEEFAIDLGAYNALAKAQPWRAAVIAELDAAEEASYR